MTKLLIFLYESYPDEDIDTDYYFMGKWVYPIIIFIALIYFATKSKR